MSGRAAQELGVGVALVLVTVAALWLWLDSTGAFAAAGPAGDTLRLVCPLH